MSKRLSTWNEEFKTGTISFKGQLLTSMYDENEQSRISGIYVLVVIALIILEISIYQFLHFNQTYTIICTIVLVILSYQIMNYYLKTHNTTGTILFTQNNLEIFDIENNRIDYVEIVQIKGVPGIPHQVFRNRYQKEEFLSLKIVFVLSDKEIPCEIYTKVDMINQSKHYFRRNPRLDELLKELDKNYKPIDTITRSI